MWVEWNSIALVLLRSVLYTLSCLAFYRVRRRIYSKVLMPKPSWNWLEDCAKCNPFKMARWPRLCQAGCLARESRPRNAIDDLLPLTLIKMEHVQEIKLLLSYCNEIVSIMILFTSQSDKMIKLKLNQGHMQRHRRNPLASLF